MSAQRERDKNVIVVVRNMCLTQRKIVSNISKRNLIIRTICRGKYRKNVQRQFPKDCVFNLTNILQKIEIISHCY